MVRLSALRTGRLYPFSQNIPFVLNSVKSVSVAQSRSAAGRINSTTNPINPSGIEPATFRLVAQCFNQLHHHVSLFLPVLPCAVKVTHPISRAGIAQSVQRVATGQTVRVSNPGVGQIFRNRPDRPRGPPSLLYNGYRVFPGVKCPRGVGVDHPPPSSAEVKVRVELYLYFTCGPSWPDMG